MRIFYALSGLLLFVVIIQACQHNIKETDSMQDQQPKTVILKKAEINTTSELASLMRDMYDRNLELGRQIEAGIIPESFPEDFYTIHKAESTPGMLHDTVFFKNMAAQYLANMKKITEAETKQEAKIAYNEMIMTCAGCHQVYCQGPLPTIRKMKLSLNEEATGIH